MQNQVAILSSGVWKIRSMVEQLTGFKPVRWAPPLKRPKFGCVVGWGLKSTSDKARKLAKKHDSSYIAVEDGFYQNKMELVRQSATHP